MRKLATAALMCCQAAAIYAQTTISTPEVPDDHHRADHSIWMTPDPSIAEVNEDEELWTTHVRETSGQVSVPMVKHVNEMERTVSIGVASSLRSIHLTPILADYGMNQVVSLVVGMDTVNASRESRMTLWVDDENTAAYKERVDIITAEDGQSYEIEYGVLMFQGYAIKTDSKLTKITEPHDLRSESFDRLYHRDDVMVFPNPAKDKVTVSLKEGSERELVSVSVYSVSGQEVRNERCTSGSSHQLVMVGLPNGMYVVKLNFSDNSYSINNIMKQ